MKTDKTITKLLVAIVHATNTKKLRAALLSADFRLTKLESAGGFLGKKSTTYLIGASASGVDDVLKIIEKNCAKKSEFVAESLADAGGIIEDIPLAENATKLSIGGATVFVIDIEKMVTL